MKTMITLPRLAVVLITLASFLYQEFRVFATIGCAISIVLMNLYYTLTTHSKLTGKRIAFILIIFSMIFAVTSIIVSAECPFHLFLASIGLCLYVAEKLNIIHI
jgi:hypothetical protein